MTGLVTVEGGAPEVIKKALPFSYRNTFNLYVKTKVARHVPMINI